MQKYWRTTAYLGMASTLFTAIAFIAGALSSDRLNSTGDSFNPDQFPFVLFEVSVFVLPAPLMATLFLNGLILIVTSTDRLLLRYSLLMFNAVLLVMQIIAFSFVTVSFLGIDHGSIDAAWFEMIQDIFFLQGNMLMSYLLLGIAWAGFPVLPHWFRGLTYVLALLNFILSFAFYSPDQSTLGYALLTAITPAWITLTAALLLIRAAAVPPTG